MVKTPPSNRRKLTVGFAFIALCSIAAAGYASMGFLRTETQVERLIEQDQALALAASQMLAQELQMGQALRSIVLNPDDETARRSLVIAADEFSLLVDKALRQSTADPASAAVLQELEQLRDKQRPIHADIVAAAKHRPADAIAIIERDETQVWEDIRQRLQDLGTMKKADVLASLSTAHHIGRTALLAATALGSLALLAVLASLLHFSRITRRIGDTLAVAEQLNHGRSEAGR